MSLPHSSHNTDIFVKCLSQFYENVESGDSERRKQKLLDSVVEAYNEMFKTNLNGSELLEQLKQREKTFQPYDWEKLLLDIFFDEETAFYEKEMDKLNKNYEILKKESMNIITTIVHTHDVDEINISDISSDSSGTECNHDVPKALQNTNYKSMSTHELKRALLVSKLEMLDAREALRKAKEDLRLNEEELIRQKNNLS